MIFSILFTFLLAHAHDDHNHKKPELATQCSAGDSSCGHEEDEGHEHAKDEDHADEHAETEENGAIGPDKGIIAKSENGFKLSPEATKSFSLKTEPLNTKTIETSESSLVTVKDFKGIYRMRDKWFKRVPVKVLSKKNGRIYIEVSDQASGDQIVTHGVGFLRGAELVTEEGVSHGHSH